MKTPTVISCISPQGHIQVIEGRNLYVTIRSDGHHILDYGHCDLTSSGVAPIKAIIPLTWMIEFGLPD